MNATLSSRVVYIPLSKLIPSKRNPRRVKPDRDAHRRKVASIRSLGLIQPLVVRPDDNGNPGHYHVIAGNGRLAALREIYKHAKKSPKIACVLRRVDDGIADALALAENVVREKMHPLNEAEEFSRLAGDEGKDAKSIAAQFGETEHYIRQRMKLAMLADPIKAPCRGGAIDTGTAEVFTSVPKDRQHVVWQEVHGHPSSQASLFGPAVYTSRWHQFRDAGQHHSELFKQAGPRMSRIEMWRAWLQAVRIRHSELGVLADRGRDAPVGGCGPFRLVKRSHGRHAKTSRDGTRLGIGAKSGTTYGAKVDITRAPTAPTRAKGN